MTENTLMATAMARHYANDVARELALLEQAEHLPAYLVRLSRERLIVAYGKLEGAMEAVQGRAVISITGCTFGGEAA